MHTHTLHLRVGRLDTLMLWIIAVLAVSALLVILIAEQFYIDTEFNQFQSDEEEDYE